MNIVEMIDSLKDENKIDFFVVYSEMFDVLKELNDKTKFKIIAKTIELSYKSVIESHNKANRVPKEVYKASILQGNMKPIEFIKKWIDGSLELVYAENLPKNTLLGNVIE